MPLVFAHGIIPCGQELPLIGMVVTSIPLAFAWARLTYKALKNRM